MKLKKVLAILLASAMTLGMSMTAFAEDEDPTTSKITINGLATEEEDTVVNLYAAVTWDKENSTWVVSEWAEKYINTSTNPFTITDKEGLTKAVSGAPEEQVISKKLATGSTSVYFDDVPVGAYVVTAAGENAVYSPMVVENYDENATYMQAKDETLTAKSSGYELTKEQKIEAIGDKFIGRGEEVTFEITTTFPMFEDPDAEDNSYEIVDTPSGLDITSIEKITLGGETLTATEDYTVNEVSNADGSTQRFTIAFTDDVIGTTNGNAGKTVVVTYKAIVTSAEGYSNTANASRDNVEMGSDSEKGWTGDITITKKTDDSENPEVLKGAVFNVYQATKAEVEAAEKEGRPLQPLQFVLENGVYKLALPNEEGSTADIVTGDNGTVKVAGLEEGDYWFEEVKAPEGYSINAAGVEKKITVPEANDKGELINVSLTGELTDSKLSELPSTGGIGTTIFTIGGCTIMIAAAGLYFASRRKENK